MHRPLLLGHRGTRRGASENTFAAFDQALAHGCDGFEFDLRRTADGRGMVCHNRSFRRLSIASHTYEQLQTRGSAVCCLEDVVARYSTAYLDIELKDAGLEEAVTTVLGEVRPQRYIVSSFIPAVLTAVHQRDAEIPLGLVCDRRRDLGLWRQLPVGYVVAHRALVSEALAGELHGAGRQLFVWTVNVAHEMKRCAELGVDAIISDDPELLGRAFADV